MANKFRTVYNSPYNAGLDANTFSKIAMQDPQFAIGAAIGNALSGAYANNYNNRGINKAVNKALEEYGMGPNVEGQQAALEQVQQDMAQQPAGVSIGMSDADALNNVRQNYGLGALQPSGPAISAGNVPQQDPQMMDTLLGTAGAAQPETREQAINRLAQMPGAAIVAQDNAARRLDNFNKAEAMARAQQQMIKDGRTPYQIEQAMAMLEPHFDRMQDDSYRLGVERIAAELGATDENGKRLLSDNEYKQRVVDLATKYGDIGKAAANVYGRDIVSGRELWNAQQQEARENRQFGRQVALDDRRFAQQNARDEQNYKRRLAIAKERGGGYSNDGIYSGLLKNPVYQAMGKRLSEIEAIMNDPTQTLTQADRDYYDRNADTFRTMTQAAEEEMKAMYGISTKPQSQTKQEAVGREINRNDYNTYLKPLMQYLVSANNGKFDENVAKVLRQKYGLDPNNNNPDEWINQVMMNDYGYNDSPNRTKNEKSSQGLFDNMPQSVPSYPTTGDQQPELPYQQTDFAKKMNRKVNFADDAQELMRLAREERERSRDKQYAGTGYWGRG